MRRRVTTQGPLRRSFLALLSTALVAALLVAVSAAVRPGRPEPMAPAAAEPAPGRIAYTSEDQEHRALALADGGRLTALLGAAQAGDDCQPSARGDTVVWVSDRSGTGESLLWRQGAGPVKVLLERPGWRLKHPVLSPDGAWVAFTSWQPGASDPSRDWCRQTSLADPDTPGADGADRTASIWVARTDGGELRRVVVGGGWASWSPDGGALAFERGGKLFRVPVAPGGTAVPVDTGPDPAHRPAWEPSAGAGHDRIAFVTVQGGYQELALVPARGGAVRPVARGSRSQWVNSDVTWSPDGGALAFLSDGVFRVDPAGTCPACPGTAVLDGVNNTVESAGWYTPAGGTPTVLVTRLTEYVPRIEGVHPAPPLDRLDLRPQAVDGTESTADPAWSPDGRRLAFTRTEYAQGSPAPTAGRPPTRVMVGDATDPSRATALAGQGIDPAMDQIEPAWSPDGKRLAFVQTTRSCTDCVQGTADRILVADVSGGVDKAKVVLTVPARTRSGYNCTSTDSDPAWSPDGSRLAFSRAGTCTPIIHLADLREAPALAAVSGVRHLWSVEAGAGGDQRDLTAAQCGDPDCPVLDERPAYAPDGGGLAFARKLLAATPDPNSPPPSCTSGFCPPPNGPPRATSPLRVLLELGPDGASCHGVIPPAPTCRTLGPVNGSPPQPVAFYQPADPAWSPDGRQLAFDTGIRNGETLSGRIAVADAATGTGQVLPARYLADHRRPSWQPTADLAVALTAAQPQVSLGGTTELTLTVTNLGPAPAKGVTAGPALPAGLQAVGVPVPSQGTCPASTPYHCALGGLAKGASATVRLTVKGVATGAQRATAQAGGDVLDPRTENDQAETVVTVLAPGLAVTATATPGSVRPGEPVTVAFTVRNQGDGTASGVTLTPVVPAGLRVVSATPACPSTGCVLGDLGPGAQTVVEVVVTGDAVFGGQVTGTVTSSNGEPVTAGAGVVITDPGTATPTATPTPTATAPPPTGTPTATPTGTPSATPPDTRSPEFAVTAAADPALIRVGQRATVTLTVRNGGAVPAGGVVLTPAVPSGLHVEQGCPPAGCALGTLAPGGEASVAVVVTGTAAGSATVTGTATTQGRSAGATATLTVVDPAVTLDPKVGPPGLVTLAHGTGFPPGAAVRLRWSAGVTAAAAPVTAAPDGTFTAPVLALAQDTLGPRELIATLPDLPALGEVRTGFVVVPGVLQPQQYQERR
ncbi:hypothetical protein ACFXDE_18060 [Kitasatospora sp. NPDC059408]|uniref:hypothetical protein n=1 Tax=Kitasatospora sp. NPDC059408 TaxID=3346823 RepID=UPI00368728C6